MAEVRSFCLSEDNFTEVYKYCEPVRAEWKTLAVHLYIDMGTINAIDKDNRGISAECLMGTIDTWLKNYLPDQKSPSWQQLIDAVAHLDRPLSERIAQEHGDRDCALCYRVNTLTFRGISAGSTTTQTGLQQQPAVNDGTGAINDLEKLKTIITDKLRANSADLEPLIREKVLTLFTVKLYAHRIFSGAVKNEPSFHSIMNEVTSSLISKTTASEVINHLKKFFSLLAETGGPQRDAAEYIANDIFGTIEQEFHTTISSILPIKEEILTTQKPQTTHKKEYAEALLKAAEEGTIKTKWSKVSISGASGVGKTSLLKLLLDEEPPKVHNSTPVIQPSPLHILAADTMTSHTMMVDDQLFWKEATKHELYKKLAKCIPHQEKSPHNSAITSLDRESPTSVSAPIQTSANTTSDTTTTQGSERMQPRAYLKRPSAQEFIECLEQHGGMDEVHFIHLLDTGGQACFIDIAPALVRFNSTNIFVHKLNEKLTDNANFYFSVDGKKVDEEHRNMTNEQLLSSLIAARRLIKQPCAERLGGRKLYSTDESQLLVIGTHHDVYIKEQREVIESLKDKSERLLKVSGLKKGEIFVFQPEQMIFPLDTTSRSDKELEIAAKIRKSIINTCLEDDIPKRWYFIHFEINEMKSQKMDAIAQEEFIKLGQDYGLNKDEVTYALQYFHDLTVCLYFHEILPDVVFLSPNYLIHKLHELICMLKENSSEESNGIFKKSRIQHFIRNHFTDDFLSFDHFLKLLEYLFIAFPLPDRDKFFISSILESHPDPSNSDDLLNDCITCNVSPAVLMWPEDDHVSAQAVPSGLFSSLCMALYQSSELRISHCENQPQFCNRITFNCPDIQGIIVLFQLPQYVGVAHTGRADKTLVVRNAVMNALAKVVEKVNWKDDIANPRIGFLCSVPQISKLFPVFLQPNEDNSWLICPKYYKYHQVSEIDRVYHLSWFPTKDNGNEKSVVHLNNLPNTAAIEQPDHGKELDTKPDCRCVDDTKLTGEQDLVAVMIATQEITDWSALCLLLGISISDYDKINKAGGNVHMNIICRWFDSGKASWSVLVEHLCNVLVHKIDLAQRIAQEHQKP